MSNFYEQIYRKAPSEEFDVEAWAKKKNETRESAYKMADEQLYSVASAPSAFLSYLDVQSRFSNYTVTNALLIMAQKPNATYIADSKKWGEGKHYIKRNEKSFTILEPDGEYTRQDGSVGMSFNPKSMFDILQLRNPPKITKPNISNGMLFYAMTYQSPVLIKILDNPNQELDNVKYSTADKTIYIPRGLPEEVVLSNLAKAYCYAQVHQLYPAMKEGVPNMAAECAAYTVCRKYGLATNDTKFAEEVGNYFEGMEGQDIKADLTNIKEVAEEVTNRTEKGIQSKMFERQSQEKQEVR